MEPATLDCDDVKSYLNTNNVIMFCNHISTEGCDNCYMSAWIIVIYWSAVGNWRSKVNAANMPTQKVTHPKPASQSNWSHKFNVMHLVSFLLT